MRVGFTRPTVGEVLRRLENHEVLINSQLRDLRETLGEKLVSSDLFNERTTDVDRRLLEVARRLDQTANRWWGVLIAVVGASLTSIGAIVVAIVLHH